MRLALILTAALGLAASASASADADHCTRPSGRMPAATALNETAGAVARGFGSEVRDNLAAQGFSCVARPTSHGEVQRCIGRIPGYPMEVAILVPPGYRPTERSELLLYLHGYNRTGWDPRRRKIIPPDTLIEKIEDSGKRLEENFAATGRNSLMIIPHSTERCDQFKSDIAPPDKFKNFIDQITSVSQRAGLCRTAEPSGIAIAGHSGAYHPIASILSHPADAGAYGDRIKEVALFDSLYGRSAEYSAWIKSHPDARFWSAYVPFTDTDAENRALMGRLRSAPNRVPFFSSSRFGVPPASAEQRVGFVRSSGDHSTTVGRFFTTFLRARE